MSSSEMVTIFKPFEPGDQMLIESVLEEAGIAFLTKNTEVQDLIGAGQIGGTNLATGGIEIQVAAEDADRARQIIDERLASSAVTEDVAELRPDPDAVAVEVSDDVRRAARFSNYSLIWSILWLGGLGSLLAVYFGIKALRLMRNVEGFSKRKAWFGIANGIMGCVAMPYLWSLQLFP